MPANPTTLTTRAECDEALASLQLELAAYQHRTSNQAYADEQAGRQAGTTAARLAKATADVAHYTAEAARPGLTPTELRSAKNALITATAQRDRLGLASAAQTGSAAYLSDIDADQVNAQVVVLTGAIAQATARKAALPA